MRRLLTNTLALALVLAAGAAAQAYHRAGPSGPSGRSSGASGSTKPSGPSGNVPVRTGPMSYTTRAKDHPGSTRKVDVSRSRKSFPKGVQRLHPGKKDVVKDYHLKYGKKFKKGYFYAGKNHHHWTYRCWSRRYGCYCFWCPYVRGWYYWCPAEACYYPVSYFDEAPPDAVGPYDDDGPPGPDDDD